MVQMYFSIIGLIFFLLFIAGFYFYLSLKIELAVWFIFPLLFSIINVEWYYYATQNYKLIFFRTLVVKLLVLILVFFFIKENNDVVNYSILMAFSYMMTSVIGYIGVWKKIAFQKLRWRESYQHIFNVRHFFANSLLGTGYQYCDQLFLGVLLERSNLAALNILKQVTAMLTILPITVCRFMLPTVIDSYLTGRADKFHKKYDFFYIFFIFFIALIFGLLGKFFIIMLTGDKYHFSNIDIVLSMCCFLSISLAVFIDTQYSIPQKKEFITTRSNFVVLVVFVFLLYPLIDCMGYSGALLGMFISESIGVVVMVFLHRKGTGYVR